jgi:ribonucleotide monophosphatase NagD (HAD superfamily)
VTTEPFDLSRYAGAVFDIDGTVLLSETPMTGAIDFVERCRDLGLTVTFATNATAVSIPGLRDTLANAGIGRPEDEIVSGGLVVARSLRQRGVTDIVGIAPPAMIETFAAEGISMSHVGDAAPPDGWEEPAQGKALVIGTSRWTTFGSVEVVGRMAMLGHPLYCTSLDPGFPALGRIEPGGGMLVAAMQAIYPVEPVVLGKPSQQYADVVRSVARTDGPLVMFGDSQRADMGTADFMGADSVLLTHNKPVRPDLTQPKYVAAGLHAPIEPFQPVELES